MMGELGACLVNFDVHNTVGDVLKYLIRYYHSLFTCYSRQIHSFSHCPALHSLTAAKSIISTLSRLQEGSSEKIEGRNRCHYILTEVSAVQALPSFLNILTQD